MGLSIKQLRSMGVKVPHADTTTRPVPKRNAKRGTGATAVRKRLILAEKSRPAMVFILPYPPSTNNLYANRGRGRVLKTEGREYKAGVRYKHGGRNDAPFVGPVSVNVVLCRQGRHVDVDNIKIALDALKGIAFVDDYQIHRLHIEKVCAATERAEVVVSPFSDAGRAG